MGLGLQRQNALAEFLTVGRKCVPANQCTVSFNARQHGHQRHLQLPIERGKRGRLIELFRQHLVQAERDLSVLSGIGRGLFYRHLVEGQLLGALARDIFKMDRPLTEVLERQGIEIVSAPRGIEYVGLQHCVIVNTAQGNTVIGQYVGIVFEMLAHLGGLRILQQWPQRLEHCVAIKLIRRARVIMGEGHVGRGTGLNRKRDANHFRNHVIEARRLGVKSKQLGGLELGKPVIENGLLQYGGDLNRGGRRRHLCSHLCTVCSGRILCRRPRGGCPVPVEQRLEPGFKFQLPEKSNQSVVIWRARIKVSLSQRQIAVGLDGCKLIAQLGIAPGTFQFGCEALGAPDRQVHHGIELLIDRIDAA